MNNSGKTLTIFMLVFAVLLMCLTGIAVFHLLKERDLRKSLEASLEETQADKARLQGDLEGMQKKNAILEGEGKEAVERIEDLLAQVEIEKGVKEELKKESRQLKETLTAERQARTELQKQKEDLEDRLAQLQGEYDQVRSEKNDIQAGQAGLQKEMDQLRLQLAEAEAKARAAQANAVDLEPIVVNPNQEQGDGLVVSVDKDADFLIVSLGKKHGIKKGAILAVNRGGQSIGEVQVSRVLPEMSAADFLPPLTSDQVQVNDQVAVKE